MVMGQVVALVHLMDTISRELLLFAGIWIAVGLVDELAVDVLWAWLKLKGRGLALRFEPEGRLLRRPAAVFIPCWHEQAVIAHTVRHCRTVWPQANVTFYIGCYPNDPATAAAARHGAGDDPRVRLVTVGHAGPTTKADCLNALFAALSADPASDPDGFVLLHDAEDHVHPAALELIDERLQRVDFVQLPVHVELRAESRWISGHYADEFAESHGKTMVVRDWLRTSLPAAGVGCAFRRDMLERIAMARGSATPFEATSLTEDYELGLLVTALGGRSRFVRALDQQGEIIATREFFPATLRAAERQKARWLHGIAFQGWDRLGWTARPAEIWMRLRDRRGPLTAVVLLAAYLMLLLWVPVEIAARAGIYQRPPLPSIDRAIMLVGFVGLAWRCLMRFAFTARQYGAFEGVLSILRLPVANFIAIMSGRRALVSYLRSLRGGTAAWDKTAHDRHPSMPYGASDFGR